MIGITFRYNRIRKTADGLGYWYDALYEDTFRGTNEWLTRIIPTQKDGKRFWITFGHEDWGHFKTRDQCASVALRKLVIDPETEKLQAGVNLRTQYNVEVTVDVANSIWAILVEECGAHNKGWECETFIRHLTKHEGGEYHLHAWIPGGKLFWDHHSIWVHGYREREDPLTRNMEARANHRIQKLLQSLPSR